MYVALHRVTIANQGCQAIRSRLLDRFDLNTVGKGAFRYVGLDGLGTHPKIKAWRQLNQKEASSNIGPSHSLCVSLSPPKDAKQRREAGQISGFIFKCDSFLLRFKLMTLEYSEKLSISIAIC